MTRQHPTSNITDDRRLLTPMLVSRSTSFGLRQARDSRSLTRLSAHRHRFHNDFLSSPSINRHVDLTGVDVTVAYHCSPEIQSTE